MEGRIPQSVDEVFGPSGKLARVLADFEDRPQQKDMAEAVAAVFNGGGALLAEAGTGTGKTMAYLAAAVISGKRAMISTGTRTLQDQLLHQDIPLLKRIMPDITAAVLKGRSNYLCRRRLRELTAQPLLPGTPRAAVAEYVIAWSDRTATGERNELVKLSDDDPIWDSLSAERDHCRAPHCGLTAECFVTRARRRAASADLVVINHHLLMAEAANAGAGADILPETPLLIIDEAHLLEDIAARALGLEVDSLRAAGIFKEAQEIAGKKKRAVNRLVKESHALIKEIGESLPKGTGNFSLEDDVGESAGRILGSLSGMARKLAETLAPVAEDVPEAELIIRRSLELAAAAETIAHREQETYQYWFEKHADRSVFRASPRDVSPHLPAVLFNRRQAVLLTSATMAVAGNFRFMKERLGLPDAAEFITGSPFDYRRQAVLYVPRGMPDPNDPEFAVAVARACLPLLELTSGRAFLLCTSRRNLRHIADLMAAESSFTVLRQGEAPRMALLERFKRETRAVLVATISFWQGIDIPGDRLSAVIIDRLPFASPDDPLVKGRMAYIRESGGDPFTAYQLPAAVIMLKQGLGRLIRRRTDRGILAVMDPRLLGRGYGRVFMRSLPEVGLVDDLANLEDVYHALIS